MPIRTTVSISTSDLKVSALHLPGTVTVLVSGGRLPIGEVIAALHAKGYLRMKDIDIWYRMEDPRKYFLTVKDKESDYFHALHGVVVETANSTLTIQHTDREVVRGQVKWIPPSLGEPVVREIVETFAEPGEEIRVRQPPNTSRDTWDIFFVPRKGHTVPHFVDIDIFGGFYESIVALITLPGRQIVCGKCGVSGHFPNRCDRRGPVRQPARTPVPSTPMPPMPPRLPSPPPPPPEPSQEQVGWADVVRDRRGRLRSIPAGAPSMPSLPIGGDTPKEPVITTESLSPVPTQNECTNTLEPTPSVSAEPEVAEPVTSGPSGAPILCLHPTSESACNTGHEDSGAQEDLGTIPATTTETCDSNEDKEDKNLCISPFAPSTSSTPTRKRKPSSPKSNTQKLFITQVDRPPINSNMDSSTDNEESTITVPTDLVIDDSNY